MARNKQVRRTRFRVGWFLSIVIVPAAVAGGGYSLYKYQRERNTQRLLSEAKAARHAGDVDRAIQSYRVYLGRKDSDAEALRAYTDLLYDRVSAAPELSGDTVRALRQMRRVEPTNTLVLERLANLYVGLGEFGLAEEIGKAWTALAPSSPDAVLAYARALYGLHKGSDAVELLVAASERTPQEPRLYPALIELLSESPERAEEAVRWTERAVEHAPDAYQVRLAAYAFFLGRKDSAAAEQHLRKTLELVPDNVDVLVDAAQFYTSAGRIDESSPLLDRAARIAPQNRRLLLARVSIAIHKNDRATMIAAADDAMNAASPTDHGLIAQAAELYVRCGEQAKADACIRRVAEDPKLDDKMKAALETLRGAQALAGNEPIAAIPHLQTALRRQPAGLWTLELLARAYLRIGAADEAADLYRRLILLAPDASAPRLALARIELRQGRIARSRELLRAFSTTDVEDARQAELVRIAADLQQMIADGGKPTECVECRTALERITADHPTDIGSVELLTQCLTAAGFPERALEVMRNWSGDADSARSLSADFGRRMLAGGRSDLASAWAKEMLERFPDAPEGYALQVSMLMADGRIDEAQRHIEQCTLNAEQKGVLWAAVADASPGVALDARPDAGPSENAVAALRRAAELMPRNIAVRQKLARRLGDLDQAEKVVDEIRALEGDDGIQWKYERASLLLRLKPEAQTASEAIGLLRDCLAARPGWVEARTILGLAQETSGALADAAESYRAAIVRRPELAVDAVAIRLVEVLKRQGRYREADDVLAPLSKALPDSPTVLRHVTDRQLRARDVSSAAATAERLLLMSQDDPAWAATTADLQLRAGQPEKAEQIARSAFDRHPQSVSLLTSLSRALFALDRPDEAETLVRRAARRDHPSQISNLKSQTSNLKSEISNLKSEISTVGSSAPFDLLLARILVERKRSDEARKVVETTLAREPQNAALHAAAADFWGAQGDRTRQLELARKAVELRGEIPAESLVLASLFAAGSTPSDREEAEAIIRRRLAGQPNDVQTLLLEAQLALTANPPDVARAEAVLTQALKADPQLLPAYKMLAAVQSQSGHLNAAAETAAVGLTLAPDDIDCLMLSAEIHQQRGEPDRSLVPLRRILALQPKLFRALTLFADASRQTHQADQAIDFIGRLSPEAQRPVAETLLLAKLFESKGDIAGAGALFSRALDDDEHSPQTVREYIVFQARRGAFDQVYAFASLYRTEHPGDIETLAIAAELLGSQSPDPDLRLRGLEWLDDIAADPPETPLIKGGGTVGHAADARYRSGLCRIQHGDFVGAETMLLRASQLAPDNPKPVNALAWLYGEELGKHEQGLATIEKFLAAGGRPTPEMLDTHGTLLLRLKRFNEARAKLSACLATVGQSPTRAAATYHLGLALLESGANSDGLTNIRIALEVNDRLGGLGAKEVQEARRLLAQSEPRP